MRVTSWFRTALFALLCSIASAACTSAKGMGPIDAFEITPKDVVIPLGAKQALSVYFVQSGVRTDVTSLATWHSSDESIASVDNTGVATGVARGTVTIFAERAGFTAAANVTVSSAVVASIELSPAAPSIAAGTTQHFHATGIYTDGTSHDLSGSAELTWSSSKRDIATIDRAGTAAALKPGATTITAAAGDASGSTQLSVSAAALVGLAIEPDPDSLAKGTTKALHLVGTFADGAVQDLTADATWISDDDSTVSVSDDSARKGFITGLKVGSTGVRASFQGKSATASITVTQAQLQTLSIDPPNPAIGKGQQLALSATGVFSDGTTQDLTGSVVWTSADWNVALVSDQTADKGTVSGLDVGSTRIVAKLGDHLATTVLTVSAARLVAIEVNAASDSLPVGIHEQLTAVGTYTDGNIADITAQVSWASADTSVVSVDDTADNKGLALAQHAGTTQITATLDSVTGKLSITAAPAQLTRISLAPSGETSLAKGLNTSYRAYGSFTDGTLLDITSSVQWSSSDAEVASVSNLATSQGTVRTQAVGSAQITASQGGIQSAPATLNVTDAALDHIEVDPALPSLPNGTTAQLSAIGVFSDNTSLDITTLVTWGSDGTAAQVSNAPKTKGLATANSEGSTRITATYMDKLGDTTLTVTPGVLQSILVSTSETLPFHVVKGLTQQFSATGVYSDQRQADLTSTVTWSSNNSAIASISNASDAHGLAKGRGEGIALITASLDGIQSYPALLQVTAAELTEISVTPGMAELAIGTSRNYAAIGIFTDHSKKDLSGDVTWTSSAPNVASIAPGGVAQGAAVGVTAIHASWNGTDSNQVALSVADKTLASITITPQHVQLPVGGEQPCIATGVFTDNTTQDLTRLVTWQITGDSASVDNSTSEPGRVTGLRAGNATLSASFAGVTSDAASVTVTEALLVSLTLSPDSAVIPKGVPTSFQARGTYSDGSKRDLTSAVTWSSSDATVAMVSATGGQASTLAAGSTTISAAVPGGQLTAGASLTVTDASLQALSITPVVDKIAAATELQLTATGQFSDGTTQVLTQAATWTSTDPSIALVSNAPDSTGLVSGLGAGEVTITAAFGDVVQTTTFSVSQALLTAIQVEPENPQRPQGLSAAFTATGYFDDNSHQDLTGQVSWVSSNPSYATISNASGSAGIATTLAPGQTTVWATLLGHTDSTQLEVTAAVVASIQLTGDASTPLGTKAHYTAIATYTDGTHHDITKSATWTSSDMTVAALCDAQATDSVCFDARARGATTITVNIQDSGGEQSASIALTVTPAALVSIQLSPTTSNGLHIPKGVSEQLTATGVYTAGLPVDLTDSVLWTVDDPTIVRFDSEDNGHILAVKLGATVVTASLDGVTASLPITVTQAVLETIDISPANPTAPKGTTVQFAATGVYSDKHTEDLTSDVTWTSDDAAVSISNASASAGQAVANAVPDATSNPVTISAQYDNRTWSTQLSVTAAELTRIEVTSPHSEIPRGTTEQYAATGIYSDGSKQDLTTQVDWTTQAPADASNPGSATIELSMGLATAVQEGPVDIHASKLGIIGSKRLTVLEAALTSITVGATAASVPIGKIVQFSATGSYTAGPDLDITDQVLWSTSNTNASVSNADGEQGVATGQAEGTVEIIATDPSTSQFGQKALTITAAVLVDLSLSPLTPSIPAGTTKQFVATATYSDNTSAKVTSEATWSSSDQQVAPVSNRSSTPGLATAVKVGQTTITASFEGMTAGTALSVTDATLTSITVTPSDASTPAGYTRHFTATGNYTDGPQDLTTKVTWSSSDEQIAFIFNDAGSEGIATAVMQGGPITINATLGAIVGQTLFTVTDAELRSIEITPADATVPCSCIDLTATGTFSIGPTEDISTRVRFTSSDPNIVNVSSNGDAKNPRIEACAQSNTGTVTITATDPATGITATTTASSNTTCVSSSP